MLNIESAYDNTLNVHIYFPNMNIKIHKKHMTVNYMHEYCEMQTKFIIAYIRKYRRICLE